MDNKLHCTTNTHIKLQERIHIKAFITNHNIHIDSIQQRMAQLRNNMAYIRIPSNVDAKL